MARKTFAKLWSSFHIKLTQISPWVWQNLSHSVMNRLLSCVSREYLSQMGLLQMIQTSISRRSHINWCFKRLEVSMQTVAIAVYHPVKGAQLITVGIRKSVTVLPSAIIPLIRRYSSNRPTSEAKSLQSRLYGTKQLNQSYLTSLQQPRPWNQSPSPRRSTARHRL